ncbi:hypothetical protein QCD79_01715 [Pseudomonas quasicaspiana]|nr:hypothetical protein [Pseudomonas quasicaspiana]
MNQKAIDRMLIELLRIPTTQRTQPDVEAAIAGIASAAQIITENISALQEEQLKLLSFAEFLASQFGATYASAQLNLHIDPASTWANSLSLSIRAPDGGFMFGLGNTAEEALRDLHDVQPREAAS